MGADGGIVGLELKGSHITWQDVHAVVPHPFLYWDDYRDDEAMQAALAAAPGGYIWSTYGSFQEWSLLDLPDVVYEAKAYGTKYPDATMYDMLLDLVTRGDLWSVAWLDWCGVGDLSWYLLSQYLWVNRGSGVPDLTHYDPARLHSRMEALATQDDPFLKSKVGEWAAAVERLMVLVDRPYSEETWT